MRHQHISFIKSFFRIVGYYSLLFSIPVAVWLLIFSEIIGILEEIGHE